eukprot:9478353-Pyramimonas_sp.AAC.2
MLRPKAATATAIQTVLRPTPAARADHQEGPKSASSLAYHSRSSVIEARTRRPETSRKLYIRATTATTTCHPPQHHDPQLTNGSGGVALPQGS